jgi:hypothetical protein
LPLCDGESPSCRSFIEAIVFVIPREPEGSRVFIPTRLGACKLLIGPKSPFNGDLSGVHRPSTDDPDRLRKLPEWVR